jgi:NADP-dependent 3-hydroxy acid dehydrogenase YdfG/acyl carrier protein/acyl-CoA thioesterase FadM
MKNSTNLENRFNKQELLEVLTRLLAQRSGFYAKVILADLGNLGHLQGSLNNSYSESRSNITSSSYQDKKQPPQLSTSQLLSNEIVESKPFKIQEQIRQKVVEIVSEKTGLAKEVIKLEYRLLDDLNLDSIKAGSLMAEIAKIYHLEGKFEPSEFANSTLGEISEAIISYLQKLSIQKPKVPSEPTISQSYVRSFTVEMLREELTTDVRDTVEKIAIACIKSHQKLAENIAQLWDGFNIPDRLLILIPETWEDLTETIEILTNLAQKTAGKICELAFIQFGNGYFSRCENNDPPTSVFSVASFAASLHLERPKLKIRVLEFDHRLSLEIINQKIKAEFTTSDNYSVAGYNCESQRHQMVYDLAQKKSQSRNVNLTPEDVIIVTGGAKGITAECAIALAEKYHCKMALVGSSPVNDEVQNTLKKYADAQLIAKYYSCNITDLNAVNQLIQKVTTELGIITTVIHGAGTNKPRRTEQVSSSEAYQEIAPKLIGAWNLITALKYHQLKYFIAFTSIIGVTGMLGNSWYAFSNETVDLLLRNLKKQTGTETITLAYSVWSEVGMGAKMGSTKTLANMGIDAIPPHLGVAEFLHWIENCADDQQIVIAAKLGGLDTWRRNTYNLPVANRYLEKVEYFEPGIELIVHCSLNRQHDLYVNDHNFNGSLLFPTVFGLEAMTQAASYVTGITNINSVKLEHISLLRPIVVPENGEIKIQIHARVDRNKVFAAISTEESNYKTPHFSAEITLNHSNEKPTKNLNIPNKSLHLESKTDIYSWLLFQGSTYQNIDKVYLLNSEQVILSTKVFHTDTSEICFSSDKLAPFILGSPLLRDVLLQSGQLPLTQNVYLPISIEEWEIFNIQNFSSRGFVETTILKVEDQTAVADVVFVNDQNEVLEKIFGYHIKSLKPTSEYPLPKDIGDRSFIENKITKGFQSYAHLLTDKPQLIIYKYSELFNSLDSETRHQIEQQVFTEKYAFVNGINQEEITWLDSGKPQIANSNLQISIAHSRTLLLMTIGQNIQGCDLEFVEQRTLEQWLDLLGNQYQALLQEFKNYDDTLCSFATRLWCVKESIFKATGSFPQLITVEIKSQKGVIFTTQVEKNYFQILTFPINIWTKNIAIVASLVHLKTSEISDKIDTVIPSLIENESVLDLINGKYIYRFQTTFKDCKAICGKTYFTNFPVWVGQLRELGLNRISHSLLQDFQTGEYGMVTNASSTRIYNEAETLNNIIGKIWMTDKCNFEQSFIDLEFEWFKENIDGTLIKIAESNLSTTWVEIAGHGIVKQTPLPVYLYDYLQKMLNNSIPAIRTENQIEYVSIQDLGEIKYKSETKPRPDLVLSSKTYQTGIYDSNSVGNLYYSNYYDWQAKTLEQFIYKLMPDVFTTRGKLGEYICLEVMVNHLQEAMPFEEIEVNMYLEKWYKNGFKLYFEYYSLSGGRRKLAYGNNTLIWALRDHESAKPVACELPTIIQDYFQKLL